MYERGRGRRAWLRERHASSPPFRTAVAHDVAANLTYRGEARGSLSRTELVAETIRLALTSDAFFAQLLYRTRVLALRRSVPMVPRLCHIGAMVTSQVCIGDPVVIAPGLYLPHGQVVIDGITDVGSDVIVFPWTTIGLRAGDFHGPHVGNGVRVGTGAKVIGKVSLGDGVQVGANAVVVDDVPASATVVGIPGRPLPADVHG
jgi:serine O-acetyltransferase